jgi:uncharacterized membrane protein
MTRFLKVLLLCFGAAHLAFGIAGVAFPTWFHRHVPPWPPLHIGQIQIAGVFDLALAALFLGAATNVRPSPWAWSLNAATRWCASAM